MANVPFERGPLRRGTFFPCSLQKREKAPSEGNILHPKGTFTQRREIAPIDVSLGSMFLSNVDPSEGNIFSL